ncbi:MAG: hypothetical protein N3B14_04450 [Thermoleophilia bacterium]|nr:hypothetical protein [Thermoleophilia bacterium]
MKKFLRWVAVTVGVLLTGIVGGVAYLAWRASKRTGRSLLSSLSAVPEEAELLASEAKARATEAIDAGLKTARERASTVKNLIPGGRSEP